jgi:CheY-like chemotaxis protein
MIYGFTRQSEGFTKIYSELGHGTTVKLYLPRFKKGGQGGHLADVAVNAALARPGEVILVVEDDAVVRSLVTAVLNDLGYTALEAADGPTGLAILRSGQRIDLLVTDIGLPGLNGRQVADGGRVSRPGLKVLFMTGYAENAAMANGFLETGMQLITKPFALDVFAARIRAVIEAD